MPIGRDIRKCEDGKKLARMLLENEIFYLVLPEPEDLAPYPFFLYTDKDEVFEEGVSGDTVYEVHNGEYKEIHE